MDEVAQALAAERRRIAARLHDGPIQELTAAQLFIDTALSQVDEAERDPLLLRGSEALRGAIASCRELMGELAADGEGP